MKFKKSSWLVLAATLLAFSSCNGAGGASGALTGGPVVGTNGSPKTTPTTAPAAPRTFVTDALLFIGSGTWSAEVSSIESILQSKGASYDTVTSAQLNGMTVDELAQYGTIIFPGGAGGTQAGSLTSDAHANIREAVQQRGLSYVGFCAGAFIAQAPAPAPGGDVSYGIGVVDGPVLEYYYLENQGTTAALTLNTFADGTSANILWYGGPMTPDTPGGVIARYPDGTPAMTELWSGKGFVVLSGPHPTATQSILSSLGLNSSDGVHPDIAWKLINAAIHQQPLPAFP